MCQYVVTEGIVGPLWARVSLLHCKRHVYTNHFQFLNHFDEAKAKILQAEQNDLESLKDKK